MRFVKRVVFDTSTLIGALLLPNSVPRRALNAALAQCEMCASEATLAELESVIGRAKFDRYLDRATRRAFFDQVSRQMRLFAVADEDEARLPRACRDPRDNKFLALVLSSDADILVSSDADLVSMDPYEGVAVMIAADFLAQSTKPHDK